MKRRFSEVFPTKFIDWDSFLFQSNVINLLKSGLKNITEEKLLERFKQDQIKLRIILQKEEIVNFLIKDYLTLDFLWDYIDIKCNSLEYLAIKTIINNKNLEINNFNYKIIAYFESSLKKIDEIIEAEKYISISLKKTPELYALHWKKENRKKLKFFTTKEMTKQIFYKNLPIKEVADLYDENLHRLNKIMGFLNKHQGNLLFMLSFKDVNELISLYPNALRIINKVFKKYINSIQLGQLTKEKCIEIIEGSKMNMPIDLLLSVSDPDDRITIVGDVPLTGNVVPPADDVDVLLE